MEGPFFNWFLQRVALYLYGPQLKARLEFMRTTKQLDSWQVVVCGTCGKTTWKGSRCDYCYASPWLQCDPMIQPFAKIARALLLLGLPAAYVELWIYHVCSAGAKCQGCLVTLDGQEESHFVCHAHKGEGQPSSCARVWCRPEREGKLRCTMCLNVFCRNCSALCATCGRSTCGECCKTFECTECVLVLNADGFVKTQHCAWHPPHRRPLQYPRDRLELACDECYASDAALLRVYESCALCAETNDHGWCIMPKCATPICKHLEDQRCETCKSGKRIKF